MLSKHLAAEIGRKPLGCQPFADSHHFPEQNQDVSLHCLGLQLATEGRGLEALAEGARLLGIDLSKPVEFRIISVGGMRVGSEPPRANGKV